MSLDRSLRAANSLVRHRNVLTRGERLIRLAEAGKWDESKRPLGLVKVANRKTVVGGKSKAEGAEAAATTAGAAPAAGASAGAAPPPAAGRGGGSGGRRGWG
ncbi:MAG: small basic protein [Phycisphaerae bacterium]|nr:small basic protein [Phycisphaerae bacterium]